MLSINDPYQLIITGCLCFFGVGFFLRLGFLSKLTLFRCTLNLSNNFLFNYRLIARSG